MEVPRRAELPINLVVDAVPGDAAIAAVTLSHRHKALGIAVLVCVVLLWTGSSELTQAIYGAGFSDPLSLTYFSNGLFVLYLPIAAIRLLVQGFRGRRPSSSNSPGGDALSAEEASVLLPVPRPGGARLTGLRAVPLGVVAGALLTPCWFGAQLLFNLSLRSTSVASATILSSSTSLFSLILSVGVGQEKLSVMKVLAVTMTMGGVALTAFSDAQQSPAPTGHGGAMSRPPLTGSAGGLVLHAIGSLTHGVQLTGIELGDIQGLLSAAAFAGSSVLLRTFDDLAIKRGANTGEAGNSALDTTLTFGVMGLMTAVVPPLVILVAAGPKAVTDLLQLPASQSTREAILFNGLLGTVLSDYLWALSVVWTSPFVATLALSLTIPVAMIADAILHGRTFTTTYVAGSLHVLAGFALANLPDEWVAASWAAITGAAPKPGAAPPGAPVLESDTSSASSVASITEPRSRCHGVLLHELDRERAAQGRRTGTSRSE